MTNEGDLYCWGNNSHKLFNGLPDRIVKPTFYDVQKISKICTGNTWIMFIPKETFDLHFMEHSTSNDSFRYTPSPSKQKLISNDKWESLEDKFFYKRKLSATRDMIYDGIPPE